MQHHCVQTDPAKHAWTRAYLIPERNRTVRRQEEMGHVKMAGPGFVNDVTA